MKLNVTISTIRRLESTAGNILLHKVCYIKCLKSTTIIYLCLVLSRPVTEPLQQPVGVADESHAPVQPAALEVTEPLEGPLPAGMLVVTLDSTSSVC